MSILEVTLTQDQRDFVEKQALAQGLASPGDYIRNLIEEAQERQSWDKMEELVLEGLDSGPPQPIPDGFFQNLRDELARKYPGNER